MKRTHKLKKPLTLNFKSKFVLLSKKHYESSKKFYPIYLLALAWALRSMFPTAHIDAIYRHGEQWSVDPLLVLGLMRQESVYQQWALSPVGAIGLMQVMPRTGAKVAAMMGDAHYSPESLENPSVNIRYGIYYLSQLLDRFGGSFPMAVGSSYFWLSLMGPALLLFLLLKVSGIPPTEAQALASRGDDYRRYQQTTSAFFPWFPKEN